MTPSTYADADAVQAYLFHGVDGLYAVTLDPSGHNIPREACPTGWHFKTAFALGVHDPVPAPAGRKVGPACRFRLRSFEAQVEGLTGPRTRRDEDDE